MLALIVYTAYKAAQLLPSNKPLGLLLVVPLFLLMVLGPIIYRFNMGVFESIWFQTFVWAGSILMGVWTTFIILSLPIDFVRLVAFVYSRISGSTYSPERRAYILNTLPFAVFLLSGGFAGLGLLQTLYGPRIKKVTGIFKDLPASLQNLKIVQISDLHVGPTIRKNYVEEVVRLTNETNPDLIFVTGDLVDAKAESLVDHLSPLANLNSKYGVYYVTGNHEYYWDAPLLLKELEKLGFEILINENKIIKIENSKVMIAGVTDPMGAQHSPTHAPNINEALKTNEVSHFKILLAHRPNACFEAENLGVNLQFSGHTHAGQFFPFNVLVKFAHKYYRGLNHHKQMQVYVNSGTGYWGPANRFGIGSEITLMTLNKQIEI